VKERGDREKKARLRDLAVGLREVRPRIFRHLKIRGRGECRVPNAPAASCALGSRSMHTSIHSGGTGNIRHSPRNGFTAYSALSPGTTALLTPSSARRVGVVANLTPASGRQNHTASPSATASARLTLRRGHRIPPHVHDDRDTPLAEAGC